MEDHDQVRCFKLFFFFEFWGRANLCTFPIISLPLFSENRRLVVFFQRKRDFSFFNSSSSLTPSALSHLLILLSFLRKQRWHFVRASHVLAKVESVDCFRYRFSPFFYVVFLKSVVWRERGCLSRSRARVFFFSRRGSRAARCTLRLVFSFSFFRAR